MISILLSRSLSSYISSSLCIKNEVEYEINLSRLGVSFTGFFFFLTFRYLVQLQELVKTGRLTPCSDPFTYRGKRLFIKITCFHFMCPSVFLDQYEICNGVQSLRSFEVLIYVVIRKKKYRNPRVSVVPNT